MLAKIQRWGNSLGLRIPRSFAAETKVEDGSMVELTIEEGNLVIRPVKRPQYELSNMLKQIKPENLHEVIDTGRAVGQESW